MPTITQKLRQEIDLLETAAINSRAQFQRVVKERDEAMANLATVMRSEKNAQDMLSTLATSHRNHIRKLFEIIFRLNLENARKSGYIERVREKDSPVQQADGPFDTLAQIDAELERERLLGATTERGVGRIIDGMDQETLDAVLGRGADEPAS